MLLQGPSQVSYLVQLCQPAPLLPLCRPGPCPQLALLALLLQAWAAVVCSLQAPARWAHPPSAAPAAQL